MIKIKQKTDGITRNPSLVSKILHSLMLEMGIKEAELARQTGLPQTTINRLLLGDTSDPRTSTLKPIAKFFGVTIGQIVGEETISSNRVPGTFTTYNRNAWMSVPILTWEESLSWIFRKDAYNINTHDQWIITERPVSNISFAIKSKPFMEPRFRKDSVLIVDPEAELQDGKFIVVSLDNEHVTIRQITLDISEIYLRHFDQTIPTIKFNKNIHIILGVIVEARIDL